MTIKDYKGDNSPLEMEASVIALREITFKKNEINFDLNERNVYSIYLLDVVIEINDSMMDKDDYIKVETETILKINVRNKDSKIFLIESPARPYYRTYYELFGGI